MPLILIIDVILHTYFLHHIAHQRLEEVLLQFIFLQNRVQADDELIVLAIVNLIQFPLLFHYLSQFS